MPRIHEWWVEVRVPSRTKLTETGEGSGERCKVRDDICTSPDYVSEA